MKIFVDADGCPVVGNSIRIAQAYGLEIVVVKNKAHKIESSYAQVVTVNISRDSADFYIFNHIEKGDVLVSQDLGLMAMALAKGALCLNQNGELIHNDNIDFLLNNRHLSQKLRREQQIYTKFKKREAQQDSRFESSLIKILEAKI